MHTTGFKLLNPVTMGQVTGSPIKAQNKIAREAVVGSCPKVPVIFNGKTVNCIMDTGSPVTLMSESSFNCLFPMQQVGPVGDLPWLKLRVANKTRIPYVGYAMMSVEVGDLALGELGIVITEDVTGDPNEPPLLGMNIIQCCWNAVGSDPQAKGNFASAPIPVKRAWEMAFDVCRCVDMAPTPGTLWPAYRYPVRVPGQSEILLWVRAPSSVQDGDCVLV